jgi:hypothetical protein
MSAKGQYLMDVLDTTKEIGLGLKGDRLDHIAISGYMQPQYQVASEKGAKSYSGGDFAPNSNNRFTLRRGRLRFDYARTYPDGRNRFQFAFQFDGTERGVFIRDFWGRFWENKWQQFAFTTGMFARPFGFEINLSSSDRESPERGRMSQILMRTERDLGAMVTFEDRKRGFFKFLKVDLGVFNGQGLTATEEFDSYKDLIGQIVFKPQKIASNMSLSGGISMMYGGLMQGSKVSFVMKEDRGEVRFVADSIQYQTGDKLPRRYYGANVQYQWKHTWGNTALRAEYWEGTQTGTDSSSTTPVEIIDKSSGMYIPFYIRPFRGAFLYLLQDLGSPKHQAVIKYDFYDPNTRVSGTSINLRGNFSGADVKFSTLGFGYVYYMSSNFKVTLWYDMVTNENTGLPAFAQDVDDDILTARVQFRF